MCGLELFSSAESAGVSALQYNACGDDKQVWLTSACVRRWQIKC